jgi:hypothetical protein
MAMVNQLVKVQEKARKLGIFVEDRDLIACPKCGLMEDVMGDGRLVTCQGVCGPDTGLRFEAHPPTGERFTCPQCGTVCRPRH